MAMVDMRIIGSFKKFPERRIPARRSSSGRIPAFHAMRRKLGTRVRIPAGAYLFILLFLENAYEKIPHRPHILRAS